MRDPDEHDDSPLLDAVSATHARLRAAIDRRDTDGSASPDSDWSVARVQDEIELHLGAEAGALHAAVEVHLGSTERDALARDRLTLLSLCHERPAGWSRQRLLEMLDEHAVISERAVSRLSELLTQTDVRKLGVEYERRSIAEVERRHPA